MNFLTLQCWGETVSCLSFFVLLISLYSAASDHFLILFFFLSSLPNKVIYKWLASFSDSLCQGRLSCAVWSPLHLTDSHQENKCLAKFLWHFRYFHLTIYRLTLISLQNLFFVSLSLLAYITILITVKIRWKHVGWVVSFCQIMSQFYIVVDKHRNSVCILWCHHRKFHPIKKKSLILKERS